MNNGLTYEEWLDETNKHVLVRTNGFGIDHLVDFNTRMCYDEGMSCGEAADAIIENDGTLVGTDVAVGEDDLYLSPFLQTAQSLPQQIDPATLYVGLPRGWVPMMDAVGETDDLPQQFLVIKSGGELQEMLK